MQVSNVCVRHVQIRPDVALELAWRNGYYDFFMPYIIQYLRHAHDKIKTLETKVSRVAVPPPSGRASDNWRFDVHVGAAAVLCCAVLSA